MTFNVPDNEEPFEDLRDQPEHCPECGAEEWFSFADQGYIKFKCGSYDTDGVFSEGLTCKDNQIAKLKEENQRLRKFAHKAQSEMDNCVEFNTTNATPDEAIEAADHLNHCVNTVFCILEDGFGEFKPETTND